MNRTRMVAGAGAAAVLALCAGTALALGGGLDRSSAGAGDVLPVLLDTSSTSSTSESTSSTDDSPSTTFDPSPTSTTDPTHTGTPNPTAAAAGIGVEEAGRIALTRVGGGHVTGVEQEVEHGRLEWKIRVNHAGMSWDVRIDALTGAITRFRSDDRGGDGRGGRDDDDNSGHGRGGDDDRGGDDNSGSGHSGGGHGDDDSGSGGGGNSGRG